MAASSSAYLVDYSRRDGRAAGVLRYFQRQNDRVLRISNFNGMSSEKEYLSLKFVKGTTASRLIQ